MNSPEYILVDLFGVKDNNGNLVSGILYNVKEALALPVLDFKYGYLAELKIYLQQMKDDPSQKYPLFWLRQPFTIKRGGNNGGFYGDVSLTCFIIAETNEHKTAEQRMADIFKPVIYPIYRTFMEKLNDYSAKGISYEVDRVHSITDRYYWGDAQAKEIDDKVDVMEISNLQIKINNNLNNCQ